MMVRTSTNYVPGQYLILLAAVELATSLLLTAHVPEGSTVAIFPLSLLNTTNRPTWLPSLQEARHADSVRLCEIDISGAPVIATVSQKASEKVRQKDWLGLLLREYLGARLPLACGRNQC